VWLVAPLVYNQCTRRTTAIITNRQEPEGHLGSVHEDGRSHLCLDLEKLAGRITHVG